MRSNDFFQRINCTMKNSFGKIKRILILIYRNHRCHISWNILYTVSLLYGLFNFLPQSSLATGKSSVSREIFRIPRGNLFLSFDQQREAFLPTMDTRVCSDGLVYVRLTGPYESLGESQRSFCWLRSSLLFSWRTARKPDRCFFFFLFFSDPQFLLLDFQTRIIPLDERGIEHFLLDSLIPRTRFLRYMYGILYTLDPCARRSCGAHENRKENVFVDFEQRRLFTRTNWLVISKKNKRDIWGISEKIELYLHLIIIWD